MESPAIRGQFYICDHTLPALNGMILRQNDKDYKSDMLTFPSAEAAMEHISAIMTGKSIRPSARVVLALGGGEPQQAAKAALNGKPLPTKQPKKITAAKLFHTLLTEQPVLSDDEVYQQVKKAFPEMSYRPTYPGWYRRKVLNQEKAA